MAAGGNGPAAGVVSFADGPLDSAAAGRLFFYLTPMDETGHHVQVSQLRLHISETQLYMLYCLAAAAQAELRGTRAPRTSLMAAVLNISV
jgi:hypothetical protein